MRRSLSSQARLAARVTAIARTLPLALTLACSPLGDSPLGGDWTIAPFFFGVVVSLPATTIPVGESMTASARAVDQNGSAISAGTLVWSPGDPSVATVSTTGVITAVGPGETEVVATAGGKQGKRWITVLAVPVRVIAFASLGGGPYQGHTCGLDIAGAAYCWGKAVTGQGSGEHSTPIPVAGGLTLVSLTVGDAQACGVTLVGVGYCWGPKHGGLVPVPGGLVFASVIAGWDHTCGLDTGGVAYCWGSNVNGAIGDGTEGTQNSRAAPTRVLGGLVFASLSARGNRTCGVTTGGAGYCWGYNGQGQLGDGTTTNRSTPGRVSGNLVFASLTTGGDHTCGLTAAGAAYCWGWNWSGMLGDGTTTMRLTPVAVDGGLVFSDLTVGHGHTCGVIAGGAAVCWGSNLTGQLGNGTAGQGASTFTPVDVAGGLKFARLTAGSYYTCGVTTAHVAYCWGNNAASQLGDWTTTDRSVPTRVK